jgi:hypothetical protein
MDPVASANGLTFTALDRPHIILWRTPPDSDSEIAHGRTWAEELVPHEMVHLHHLTWPDLGGFRLRILAPRSAVARKCPGWAIEGYATFLEGRLTGMGRPHGAYRAQVLRMRAREGRLPAFGNLSDGEGRYLVSSAFLEWLEQRGPARERSFPGLWARLSSRRYPDFTKAFQATFGMPPETAYRRFCAELTHSALELERRVAQAGPREGESWGFVPHPVQDLAVSPDGRHLLGRVSHPAKGGLWVWSLDARPEGKAAEASGLPSPAPDLFPERKASRRLTSVEGQHPQRPRWTSQGVAYQVFRADEEGTLHRTDRIWKPLSGSPGTPAIETLLPAWEGSRWVVRAEGLELPLPFEPLGPLGWDKPRKLLYASRSIQGIPNLVRLSFDPRGEKPFGPETVLTRTASAALCPAPTPDGKTLYFAVPRLEGVEIRRLDLTAPLPPLEAWSQEDAPFVPGAAQPRPDEPGLLPAPGPVPPARDYRVADTHQASLRLGLVSGPAGRATQLGLGGRDLLPRLDWAVLGSVGQSGDHGLGPRGILAGASWRGWAWTARAQAFSQLARPSRQWFAPVEGWDQERRGGELALERTWFDLGSGLKVQAALAGERVEPLGCAPSLSRRLAWAKARHGEAWERNGWSLQARWEVQGAAGRTGGQSWSLQRAQGALAGGYRSCTFTLEGEAGTLGGSPTALDRFHLGGQDQGLVPASLAGNALFQPGLPAHLGLGDRFRRWRAEGPLGIYVEGVALWDKGQPRPSSLRVAGIEARADSRDLLPYMSDLIRRSLGAFELRAGIHQALDGPSRNRQVFTLAFLTRY